MVKGNNKLICWNCRGKGLKSCNCDLNKKKLLSNINNEIIVLKRQETK
jgi:hypothetical protein